MLFARLFVLVAICLYTVPSVSAQKPKSDKQIAAEIERFYAELSDESRRRAGSGRAAAPS